MDSNDLFKFYPFNSFVHPSFWHKLAEHKIDIDRLNDKAKNIFGFYTNSNSLQCLLEIDCTAFNTLVLININNLCLCTIN